MRVCFNAGYKIKPRKNPFIVMYNSVVTELVHLYFHNLGIFLV